MRESSLDEIKTKAHPLQNAGMKWHFHILTPICSLNEKHQYAFILECPDKNVALVHYSDNAEKELGQELAPLLHGAKVLSQESTDTSYKPTETVMKIVKQAKSLNEKGIEWHHHMLFPDCQFNKNSPQFTLVFEDPEAHETLESLRA